MAGTAQFGRLLILCGTILVIVGVMFLFGDKFSWFRLGRLPGDFSWTSKDGSVRLFFPLMTGLLLSVLLSLIFWLVRK